MPDIIEYRTACRLSDQVKLQFLCTLYSSKYLWIIFLILFAIIVFVNGGSLDALRYDPWSFLPLLFGLIGMFAAGPIIVFVRWSMGQMAKEICANISGDGVKIIGESFNFEGKWPKITWIREGRAAYLMKFKGLLVRLPKRGFAPGQEAQFRNLVAAIVPAGANRLP